MLLADYVVQTPEESERFVESFFFDKFSSSFITADITSILSESEKIRKVAFRASREL